MEKKYSYIFLGLSAAFFVFVVGLTAYRIEDTRKQNALAADERTQELADVAASLRETAGGFDSSLFKAEMKYSFEREPRLLLLSIHSDDQGMLYLITRNRIYLEEPAQVTPEWRGVPTYRFTRGYETVFSRPVSTGSADAALDALFVVMAKDDFYGILRDDLYLFLAFLFVCGLFILIVTSIQTDSAEPGEPSSHGKAPAPDRLQGYTARDRAHSSPAPDRAHSPPAPDTAHGYAAPEVSESAHPTAAREAPDRALYSPSTGLAWEEHFPPRLRAEIDRASAADQDLALARVLIDDPPSEPRLSALRKQYALALRESSGTTEDLVFEAGPEAFSLVLPDTDIDTAVSRMEGLRKRLRESPADDLARTVSIGVASRGGRLIDDGVLLEEAKLSAEKASREGGDQVIGFRADPAKFREVLNSLTP